VFSGEHQAKRASQERRHWLTAAGGAGDGFIQCESCGQRGASSGGSTNPLYGGSVTRLAAKDRGSVTSRKGALSCGGGSIGETRGRVGKKDPGTAFGLGS
jgi:hypothetical protein